MLRLIDASNNIIFDNSFTSTFAWCFVRAVRVMSDECFVSFSKPSAPDLQLRKSSRFSSIKRKFCHHGNLAMHWKRTTKTRRTTQQTLKPMKSASITLAKVATVFFSNSPVTCPTLPKFRKQNRMKGIKPELLPQCSG